jgi:hypothetical protein
LTSSVFYFWRERRAAVGDLNEFDSRYCDQLSVATRSGKFSVGA